MAQIAQVVLLAASTTASAAASYKQSQQARAQARTQQRMMNYQAKVEEREAEMAKAKAQFEQKRQSQAAAREKGALIASLAKEGGLGSPVAADLSGEQASELELENLLIGYEGEAAAKRRMSQAALDRMQGRIYKQRGRDVSSARQWQAGASLLQGFGTASMAAGGGYG